MFQVKAPLYGGGFFSIIEILHENHAYLEEEMKKRYQALVLAAGILVLALVFYRNHTAGNLNRYQVQVAGAFDTVTVITGYAGNQAEFAEQVSKLEAQLTRYHELFDIYHTYDGMNNLKTINDNAGREPVKADAEIIHLLKLGIEMYEETGGKVNIAYGSVLQLWHDYREAGMADPEHAQLPSKEELQERAAHTDIGNIIIDEEASTVYLADKEMSLDVGSIGKGYAVQCLSDYAKKTGMDHLLISAGGNICTIGTHPDGKKWTVGIQNPDMDSAQTYIQKAAAADCSFVTSGNYQRYYEVDGKRYCHIIDGDTMMPAEHMASVTVRMEDSGKADAWSTALFNMEYEAGKELVESQEGMEALWVLTDGTVKYSSGFSRYQAE